MGLTEVEKETEVEASEGPELEPNWVETPKDCSQFKIS